MSAFQPSPSAPAPRGGTAAAVAEPARSLDHEPHGHEPHGLGGHDHLHHAAAAEAPPPRRALSPLASGGAARVAKTSAAIVLLWAAVAWALGMFGA